MQKQSLGLNRINVYFNMYIYRYRYTYSLFDATTNESEGKIQQVPLLFINGDGNEIKKKKKTRKNYRHSAILKRVLWILTV